MEDMKNAKKKKTEMKDGRMKKQNTNRGGR